MKTKKCRYIYRLPYFDGGSVEIRTLNFDNIYHFLKRNDYAGIGFFYGMNLKSTNSIEYFDHEEKNEYLDYLEKKAKEVFEECMFVSTRFGEIIMPYTDQQMLMLRRKFLIQLKIDGGKPTQILIEKRKKQKFVLKAKINIINK
jgi:hypothetical protein